MAFLAFSSLDSSLVIGEARFRIHALLTFVNIKS